VILSTRGWEPIYGVDIIARAFVTAAQQCPELQLIMLGNGSLAASLRQIFARGNVEEQVMFPGQVKYSDLPRYYQMADLYVCASHSDGSSISLLEAMACGKPVLVSDIPGNREWVSSYAPLAENVENPDVLGRGGFRTRPSTAQGIPIADISASHEGGRGNVGWLFPDGDADALAQAILYAVRQRRSLPEMGLRARSLAEERADWKKNFPSLCKAYEIALLKKGRTGGSTGD
jgi:glycosyltransferase involved in cell wall biosynthesis